MKPLMLKGGERSLTKIVFNRDGDLLFSTSKDKEPFVWYSANGERVGTYQGHKGAVWNIDVSYDSTRLVTGAGDNHCILWDTETGSRLAQIQAPTPVRCVEFGYSGDLFFYTTLSLMNNTPTLNIIDMREGATSPWMRAPDVGDVNQLQSAIQITLDSSAYAAVWSHLDDQIVTGHDKGELFQYDIRGKNNEAVNFNKTDHKKRINDIQISADQTTILTSSKDQNAKLFDSSNLECLKVYKSERPVNSASLSPLRDHLILGGGEEAMTVTQTAAREGAFEAKLYHVIFEEEFARIKGHFGPINTIAFHPDGRSYASGAEDGYIRIQSFDQEYYDFDFDF